jgi:pilus assembly protein CpaF
VNLPPEADSRPFTIIVSEKGGAERRQTFDTSELNVGRVQGNELMLPKGNVSKRHARLLFRDGRFIVTDLNSTNGTYVNRRRIAQATIVREGDRIYIGDFVLRIEIGGVESFDEKTGSTGRPSFTSSPERISLPDSSAPAGLQEEPSTPLFADETQTPGSSSVVADSDGPTPNRAMQGRFTLPDIESQPNERGVHAGAVGGQAAARHRAAVQAVVGYVLVGVDSDALASEVSDETAAQVVMLANEKAAALAKGRELPEDLTAEATASDAISELLELGPLGSLMGETAVTHIAIPRYDQLTVTRGGRLVSQFPTFSCSWSLDIALKRLAKRANAELPEQAQVVDFNLADGTRVSGARGDAAPTGTLLVVRKPRLITSTLEKLVRRGAISRAIATFLSECVAARLNLLVVGPRDEGSSTVLSALAAACGNEHIVALSGIDDVVAHTATATRLNIAEAGEQATQLLKVATRIPEARVVATLSDANIAAAAIEAIGEGIDGVLASFRAPDLRRATQRLPAELTVARPGVSLEASREWVRSCFDVMIEVARLRDGRIRVLRIAEIASIGADGLQLSDIFRFVVERVASGGAIEGSFVAGERPRVVEQMESVGIEIDSSVFTRSQSR